MQERPSASISLMACGSASLLVPAIFPVTTPSPDQANALARGWRATNDDDEQYCFAVAL
jgi:hypothetical protein